MSFRDTAFGTKRLEVDGKLIQRIAQEDAEAFRLLYEQAAGSVFAYAFSLLRNREDAKDAMQDTFLKIRSAAHLYQDQGKPEAWILTITRNICNMHFRTQNRFADVTPDEMRSVQDLSQIRDHELRITLQKCFEFLDESEREVIILHALTGLKHREIASMMKMPLATVLSKYARGMKKLRQQLEGI